MLFYVDVETTGCPGSGSIYNPDNRIVQLSCVGPNNASFNQLVNPEVHIPQSSTDIHRITNTMVFSNPAFRTIFPMFRKFVNKYAPRGSTVVLVAHNAYGFDMPIIQKECDRNGLRIPTHWYFYDTLPIYRQVLPTDQSKKLGDLYQRAFSVGLEGAHDALADSKALQRLFEHDLTGLFCIEDCVSANTYVYLNDDAPASNVRGIGQATQRRLNKLFQTSECTVGMLRAFAKDKTNAEVEMFIRQQLKQNAETFVYSIWLEMCMGNGELPHRMFTFFPFVDNTFSAIFAPKVLECFKSSNIRSIEQLKRAFMYSYKENKHLWNAYIETTGASHYHVQMMLNATGA